MMRCLVVAAVLLLVSCAPSFEVQRVDTAFNPSPNALYLTEGNRISTKSVAGGIHVDEKGIYLNPFVERAPTGQVAMLGLSIINRADYDTVTGGPNQLGVIRAVTFRLADGHLLSLPVGLQANQTSDTLRIDRLQRAAAYEKRETGIILLTPAEFALLASADSLACQIVGTGQTVTYHAADISPAFLANLKTFYLSHVR